MVFWAYAQEDNEKEWYDNEHDYIDFEGSFLSIISIWILNDFGDELDLVIMNSLLFIWFFFFFGFLRHI